MYYPRRIVAPYRQRGAGIGGIFKGLLRTVTPMMKRGLTNLGKRALNAGVDVIDDYQSGVGLKQSIKNRSKENFNQLLDDATTSVVKRIKLDGRDKSFSRSKTTGKRGRSASSRKSKNIKKKQGASTDIFN